MCFKMSKQGMVPTFVTNCNDLISCWREKSIDSGENFEVDVAIEMQRLTSNIIAQAAFGTSFDAAKIIFELQKKQVILTLEAYYSLYFPGLRYIFGSVFSLYLLKNIISLYI